MDDAPPDVRGNELDAPHAAFLDDVEKLVRLTELVARRRRGPALPGPEAMLCDLQDGALDHA